MDPNKCSEESTYEGIVRIRWCVNCCGWHFKRSWQQSSASSSTAFWLGSGEHLWIDCDEWHDRHMRNFVSGCAQTCRILEEADDRGEVMLELD